MYGLQRKETRQAGEKLLTARRLVEHGVRFVRVYAQKYGAWESHRNLKENHARLAAEIDLPDARLLKDLQRTGLWSETVVVFCTEFGRTPGAENRGGGAGGRDHPPHGFTVWMAGAGIKGGVVLVQRMNWAFTLRAAATTSRTFTPLWCTCWVLTPSSWRFSVTNVSTSTAANRLPPC